MTTPNGDSEEKRRLLIANYDDPILSSDLLRDYDSVISADFSDSRLALVVVKSWSWPRMQNTLFGIWIVERFFKDFDIDNRSRIPTSELLGESDETPQRKLLIVDYGDPILGTEDVVPYDTVISVGSSDDPLILWLVKSRKKHESAGMSFGWDVVRKYFSDFEVDNRSRIPTPELLGDINTVTSPKLLVALVDDMILQLNGLRDHDIVVSVDLSLGERCCTVMKHKFDPKLVGQSFELSFLEAYRVGYEINDRSGLGIVKIIRSKREDHLFDVHEDDRLTVLLQNLVDEFGQKSAIKMLEEMRSIYQPQVLTIGEDGLNPSDPCLLTTAKDIVSHRIVVVELNDGGYVLIKSDAGDSPIPRTISSEEYEALLSSNPPTIHREALLTLLRTCDGNANSQRGFGWNPNQLGARPVFGDPQFPHESPLRPVPMQPGFFRPTASTIAAGISRTGEQVLMPKSFVSDGVAEVGITATEVCRKNAATAQKDEPRQKKLLILSHATATMNSSKFVDAGLYDAILRPTDSSNAPSMFNVLKSDINVVDDILALSQIAWAYAGYDVEDRSGLNITGALKIALENLRQEKKKGALREKTSQKKLKLAIIDPTKRIEFEDYVKFDAIEVATPVGEGDVLFTNVKEGPLSGVEHERPTCVRSNDLDWLSSIYRDYEIHDLTDTKSGKRLIDAVEARRNQAD